MKAFGADILECWNNHWPKDMNSSIADGSLFAANGDLVLEPTNKYDLAEFGWMDPKLGCAGLSETFEDYFRRWRKKRTVVSMLVTIDRYDAETIATLIKERFPKARVIE